jgi:hypothetical protein
MALGTTVSSRVLWQGRAGPAIECPVDLLDEIRAKAVSGFRAFARGGLEVGGILYGARDGPGLIRVQRFAGLESDHARGPRFALSERDHAAFAMLLQPPNGLQTVGWFCSHTRRGLELGPADLEIFDSYFPQPGTVALILKPAALGPARAIFYTRGKEGFVSAPGAGSELLLEPVRKRVRPRAPEPALPEAPSTESAAPAAEPVTSEFPEVPPEAAEPVQPEWPAPELPAPEPAVEATDEWPAPPPPRPEWPALPPPRLRKKRFAAVWVTLAAAVAAAGIFAIARFAPADAPPAPLTRNLGLSLQETGSGQVRIAWDRQSQLVAGAQSGTLEIRDNGKSVRLPLSKEDLQGSSATYEPQSKSVEVELSVTGATGGTDQTARLTLSSTPQSQAALPPPGNPARQVAESDDVRRPEPDLQKPAAQAPRGGLSESKPAATVVQPSAERSAEVRPVRVFVPALPNPRPDAPVQLTAPPPAIGGSQIQPRLPADVPGTVMSVPAPVQPPQPQGYSGPRSGRVIWTGTLDRRGVVEIDGSHASLGSLLGGLPGVPVSIRLSPAEFNDDGLVIRTSDASKNGAREPPGSGNGWNKTVFQWDPAISRQLVLLEQPNPANRYARIALRNDGRPCSVIVIEWAVR